MNVNKVLTKHYENKPLHGLRENKPNQTQFYPHRLYACFNFLLWEVVRRKLAKNVDYPQRRIHNDRQILHKDMPALKQKMRNIKMTLKTHGKNISDVEVSHINGHGLWLCVKDKRIRKIIR